MRVPAPVSQARSTAVADRHPAPHQRLDQRWITLGGGQDDDDPGVRTGRKGGEGVGELPVPLDDPGPVVVAARRHQPPAQDHDARTLPLLQPAGDVPAGGP